MQRQPPPPPGNRPSNNTAMNQSQQKPPPPSRPFLPIAPSTFSENDLPSVKSKFKTVVEERSLRSKTCRFIEEASKALKLPPLTYYTAMVFFHRFYAVHSFEDKERFEVAVACILLAAKTEESPKKLVTVIQECHKLKTRSAKRATTANTSSPNSSNSAAGEVLDNTSREFIELKERILLHERVILHTIGFELSIDHPHKYIVEIETMYRNKQIETQPENAKIMQKVKVDAHRFANDSMYLPLCLQYESKTIAAAIIYMSAIQNKLKPAGNQSWLEILDGCDDFYSLFNIAKQILDYIGEKKGMDRIKSEIENDLKLLSQKEEKGESDAKRQRR